MYVCLVLFPIISYVVYGVKPYIMPEDFEKFGSSLPYWFTSIRTIYNYIAFWVFLGLFGNIVKSKKWSTNFMEYLNSYSCFSCHYLWEKIFSKYDCSLGCFLVGI